VSELGREVKAFVDLIITIVVAPVAELQTALIDRGLQLVAIAAEATRALTEAIVVGVEAVAADSEFGHTLTVLNARSTFRTCHGLAEITLWTDSLEVTLLAAELTVGVLKAEIVQGTTIDVA
jgi:hypothetical protein